MSNLVHQSRALPSLEKARVLLQQCRTDHEVKKIRSIAQAVATLERGKELGCDAGEIIVAADKRRAELEAEDRAERIRHRPQKGNTHVPLPKSARVAESRRAPLLTLKDSDERAYFKACRAKLVPPTAMGAAALAKLPPTERAQVLANLAKPGAKIDVRAQVGTVKLAAKRSLAEEIRANPVVTPDGRYQVIVSDPPWKYDTRAEDTSHRGKNMYPDMTTDEICSLPVQGLAQENCVLWLWTTNAFMRDAYRCLDAWGFREKTILTWDKELLGLGDWLRNVTEHCILAVRGRPIVSLTNQTTIIREKRREHSRKPEAFYALVEQLCPGSKVEMFSRANRDGWAAWGAEAGKFDGR